MFKKKNNISTFFIKRFIVPASVVTILMSIMLLYFAGFIYNTEIDKRIYSILNTASILVSEPLMTGDHYEGLRRISLIAENQNINIVVKNNLGDILFEFPPQFHLTNTANKIFHKEILSKERKKLGDIAVVVKETNFWVQASVLAILLMAIVYITISYWLHKSLRLILNDVLSLQDSQNNLYPSKNFYFDELQQTYNSLKISSQLELASKVNEEKQSIFQQIAHDIRAPLAVLQQTLSDEGTDKKMILQATKRIQSIAENLLSFNKAKIQANGPQPKHTPLKPILKNMVVEKRHRSKNSKILFFPGLGSQNIFLDSESKRSDLERILSNLIDNSLEASVHHDLSEIKIYLENENDLQAKIIITDNGPGISPEIFSKLCQKGATFGKSNGNGLGLYHAKITVEEWGGEFKIESQVGVGTTVSFTVPVVKAPDYFAFQLSVQTDEQIVILDDDQSIIDLWKTRFSKIENFKGVITAFTKILDFENWLGQQSSNHNFTFLSDYDLGDEKTFGLDVIERNGLTAQSILVTGRSQDIDIQNRVQVLGSKLLAKEMIEDIDIQILSDETNQNKEASVLIDDDELIRGLWQNKAKAKNILLTCYESTEEFLKNLSQYSTLTPIYVDSDLKGEKGEDFIKYLTTQGFLNVTLATGHPKEKFKDMLWIKNVMDKSPPW